MHEIQAVQEQMLQHRQGRDAWPEDRPNSREEERAAGHGDGDEATTSAAANLRADDYMFDDQEQDGVED